MDKILQYPSNLNGNEEILGREVPEEGRKVIAIEEKMPHIAAETICVFCGGRGFDVFPWCVKLADLECSACRKTGGVILTGQPLEEED
jgi:hypothetical protein